MSYEVHLTLGARRDLEDIYRYLATKQSAAAAERAFAKLIEAKDSLAEFPERGSRPRELGDLTGDYRQRVAGPYRLIYRVLRGQVFIQVIADGRRDMRTLLTSRLVDP